ncbi:MAG: redoxin domain-containing protein [Pyrinomonadaceae bacterium]|nr:redoxin domain-containing protein [Pyrinomonadaceae bacterium]
MKTRSFNWPLWAGFLFSLVAFVSYFFVFVRFPVTRDFPWANLLLFGMAAALLLVGVRRAFAPERRLRSKIAGLVVATLSVALFGLFVFSTFMMARWLPASHGAPQVGQKAPDFSLSDTNGRPVSLSELLSTPINGKAPKGVLLVFYRGYW